MRTIHLRPVCAAIVILCAQAPAFAQDANGGAAQAANPGANESQNARAAADAEAANQNNGAVTPAAPTQPAQQSQQIQQITVTGLNPLP